MSNRAEGFSRISVNSSNTRDNRFNAITLPDSNLNEDSMTEVPLKDNLSTVDAMYKHVEKDNESFVDASFEVTNASNKCRRKRWLKNVNILNLPRRKSIKKLPSSVDVLVRENAYPNNETGSRSQTLEQLLTENIAVIEQSGSTYENATPKSDQGNEKNVFSIETKSAFKKTMSNSTNNDNFNNTDEYDKSVTHEKGSDGAFLIVEKLEELVDDSDRSTQEEIEYSDSQQSFERAPNLSTSRPSFEERHITSSHLLVQSDIEDADLRSTGIQNRNAFTLHQRNSVERDIKISEVSIKQNKKNNKHKTKMEIDNQISDDENIEIQHISVLIHGIHPMESDLITRHPMVKVYVVESSSGNYLKNPETLTNGAGYLQPLVTGTFDFKEHRSMIPQWNEELIFEYDFKELLKVDNDQILLFFEVVDLLNFTEASSSYDQYGSDGCWRRIAWAFMNPFGAHGISRMNKTVRLQLYRPVKNAKTYTRKKCEVWTLWKSNIREKYCSTIILTVSPVKPRQPIKGNDLTWHNLSMKTRDRPNGLNATFNDIILPRWNRLTAQSCKIPNELMFDTATSDNGCSYVAFSNDGEYLACANLEEFDYPIAVYKIDQGAVHVQFLGHNGFVYTLDWSIDNDYLLSISSDRTARLWDVRNKVVEHVQMLPHPAYVYCGKFDPTNPSLVATGCQDYMTRMWFRRRPDKDYELLQQLEGHEGFVNSICFQKDGGLLTADSLGVILQWTKMSNCGRPGMNWQISKTLKNRDIEGVIINTISLHPLGSRLLVHSRDNGLRMLDLATGVVLQRFEGLKNLRIQTTAHISPCGSLVLCGGEDSTLNVWDLESGRRLAKYEMGSGTISCVDYHPYDHILAYSNLKKTGSAKVLRFAKNATGECVSLKLIAEDNAISVSSTNYFGNSMGNSTQIRDKTFQNSRPIHDQAPIKSIEHKFSFKKQIDYSIPSISTDNIYKNTEESGQNVHTDLKLKFRMLNESDQNFKGNSPNRLNTIIEKIDIILSTSTYVPSRKPATDQSYDTYSGCIQSRRRTGSNSLGHCSKTDDQIRRISDNEYDNSTCYSKSKLLPMAEFRSPGENANGHLEKAWSGNSLRADQISLKTFGNSATKPEPIPKQDKIGQVGKLEETAEIFHHFEDDTNVQIESKPVHSRNFQLDAAFPDLRDNDSMTDSGGTYIIVK